MMQAGLTYFALLPCPFPSWRCIMRGSHFRSTGNSKVSMQASLVMNRINVGGNALCVAVRLAYGRGGVAIPHAGFPGRAAGIMMGLASRPEAGGLPNAAVRGAAAARYAEAGFLGIGAPSALENCLFQLGRVVVVGMIAPFGTMQTSRPNAVANTLDSIGLIIGQPWALP